MLISVSQINITRYDLTIWLELTNPLPAISCQDQVDHSTALHHRQNEG